MTTQVDLYAILPEELFDEVPVKPQVEMTKLIFAPYVSNFLPNEHATLHLGDDGVYYVAVGRTEPIGDYGTRYVDTWYKCNDDAEVAAILTTAPTR